jgi:hypothetical protein
VVSSKGKISLDKTKKYKVVDSRKTSHRRRVQPQGVVCACVCACEHLLVQTLTLT